MNRTYKTIYIALNLVLFFSLSLTGLVHAEKKNILLIGSSSFEYGCKKSYGFIQTLKKTVGDEYEFDCTYPKVGAKYDGFVDQWDTAKVNGKTYDMMFYYAGWNLMSTQTALNAYKSAMDDIIPKAKEMGITVVGMSAQPSTQKKKEGEAHAKNYYVDQNNAHLKSLADIYVPYNETVDKDGDNKMDAEYHDADDTIHANEAGNDMIAELFLTHVFNTVPSSGGTDTKQIGSICSVDSECMTNQCENADDGKAYCVCGELDTEIPLINDTDSKNCAKAYPSVDTDPNNWICKDGADATYDLNYCLHKTKGPQFPIPPKTPSAVDLVFDTTAAATILGDELQKMIDKPQLRIAIPGLTFTDVDELKTVEEDGATYIFFPFLAEYIAAVYKYAIYAMGVVAVVMLMLAGFSWITSGGSQEGIQKAKGMIMNAVIGLFLAVGSYTLLYTINPELVEFRNLKVLTIPAIQLDVTGLHEYDKNNPESAPIGEIKTIPTNAKNISEYLLTTDEGTFVDCSDFPGWDDTTKGGKGPSARKDCRKACLESLSEDAITKVSNPEYRTPYTGYIDCVSLGLRDMDKVNYIVIHEGAVEGAAPTWWKRFVLEQKQLGTHYFIERSGKIIQLLDERFNIIQSQHSTNGIGIDLDAGCTSKSSKPHISKTCNYKPAQYASLNKLIAEIKSRRNIIKVEGHCELNSPDKGHTDPRKFDWSKIKGEDNESHRGGNCQYAL